MLAHAGGSWAQQEGGEHVGHPARGGGGALGVLLGGTAADARRRARIAARARHGRAAPTPDMLPSAVGLVWRALVLWLLLMLLLTLANSAP